MMNTPLGQLVLDNLPRVRDKRWTVNSFFPPTFSNLRDENGRCPICSVMNVLCGSGERWAWNSACSKYLGRMLTEEETDDMLCIVHSADGEDDDLRKYMVSVLTPDPE